MLLYAIGLVLVLVVVVVYRSVVVVPEGVACVVERLGRYERTLTAGLQILVPFVDRIARRFSLAPATAEVSDVCISLDNVPVSVTSDARWRIVDPQRAAYGAADAGEVVTGVLRTCQRDWIARRSWNEVRESTRELEAMVAKAAAAGVASVGVEIDDLRVRGIDRKS